MFHIISIFEKLAFVCLSVTFKTSTLNLSSCHSDIVPQKVKASILMEQALQAMQADAKDDMILNPPGGFN